MALLKSLSGWWKRSGKPVREAAAASPAPVLADVDAHADLPSREWAGALIALAGPLPAPALSAEETAPLIAAAKQALIRFAEDPQRLPRRPQLLPQLLSTLNDDASSGRDIAGIIARDPALAATLLKLANSALYRTQPSPVESLDRAVAMIGTEGLRHLVAVALMQPVMRVEGGVFGRLPELLWDHTQRTALLAADAARVLGREDVFAVQLIALLQGLGAVVVVQVLRDVCLREGTGMPDATAMATLLQRWSPRLGRAVAREWQLSERVMQALDEQGADELARMSALARALALAAPLASAEMVETPVADAA